MTRRATGKRVFESKIAGSFKGGSSAPEPKKEAAAKPVADKDLDPAVRRIKELVERALKL